MKIRIWRMRLTATLMNRNESEFTLEEDIREHLALATEENIRQGIDLMASKTKDFLVILQKYQVEGPELEIYKENLEDAIEGTTDAQNEAEKAKKKAAPPPVRRKN